VPADGNDILIWGTLSEGACYLDAVAPVTRPYAPQIGFDCYSNWAYFTTPAVSDPKGTFVYVDGGRTPHRPASFVPDSWTWDDTLQMWQYPSSGNQNDPWMPATACVSTDDVDDFVLQEATGAYAYACALAPTDWHDASGAALVSGAKLYAWNQSDVLLGTDGNGASWYVWDAGTRQQHAVTGLPAGASVADARANQGGFWMALVPSSGGAGQLWSISGGGGATKVTDYGPTPANAPTGHWGVLDAKGAIYTHTAASNDVVVRYPPDGSQGTIIYQESDAPAKANTDANGYFLGPYHPWVFFHISYMFHGP
jgi:hypothetical protein